MPKIILLGYMGSGKTTIAATLAAKTGLPSLDLDQQIEEHTGMTIPQIFAAKGEIWFRKNEHLLLKQLLDSSDDFILSLGGGTPCYANNHELVAAPGIVSVYLKASIQTLYQRLLPSLDSRPLLADENESSLTEFIAKHLFERRHFYAMATYTISIDEKKPEEIAGEILAAIVQ